jgi:hypothetical protein
MGEPSFQGKGREGKGLEIVGDDYWCLIFFKKNAPGYNALQGHLISMNT